MLVIIVLTVYLLGFIVAYAMNRVEVAAEKATYTKGGRLFNIFLSLFSWLTVLYMAFAAWFAKVNASGYWNQPVKPEPVKEEAK